MLLNPKHPCPCQSNLQMNQRAIQHAPPFHRCFNPSVQVCEFAQQHLIEWLIIKPVGGFLSPDVKRKDMSWRMRTFCPSVLCPWHVSMMLFTLWWCLDKLVRTLKGVYDHKQEKRKKRFLQYVWSSGGRIYNIHLMYLITRYEKYMTLQRVYVMKW